MSVLIIGARGNMGRRYGAILEYLGKDFHGMDVGDPWDRVRTVADRASGIIVATPTNTHAEILRRLTGIQVPILCEKPVTKDVGELKNLLGGMKDARTPFRMVNQYRVMVDRWRIGRSHYDYFRHGSDGIYWDCMQIIGLARGDVRLGETSPIWSCVVNGQPLSLAAMDAAYIKYVQDWFRTPNQDMGEIIATHEKTAQLEKEAAFG